MPRQHRYGQSTGIALGGKAQVYCVHNREKRQVKTEEQVALLGLSLGIVFKKGIHQIHLCPCCSNLFVADGKTERYCTKCSVPPVFPLGGPLDEPKGVVA
jgi:hypothetical protein